MVDYVKHHPQQPRVTQQVLALLQEIAKSTHDSFLESSPGIHKHASDVEMADEEQNMLWSSLHSTNSANKQSFLSNLSDKISALLQAETKAHEEHLQEDDFEFMEIIGGGKGSFATVYKAKKKIGTDTKLYAVKVIKKELVASAKQDVHHPFVVELRHSFSDDKRAYFVYDYTPGNQIIQCAKEHKRLSEERARFYAAEMVLVIEYFHSKGIIYRGLNPQQILLDTTGHILVLQKLELVEDKGSQLEDLSTCEYIGILSRSAFLIVLRRSVIIYLKFQLLTTISAPEILEGREETLAVDWWALGILIYQFFTGQVLT